MTEKSPPEDQIEKARKVDEEVDEDVAKDIAIRKAIYGLAEIEEHDDCGLVEAANRAVHNVEVITTEQERLRNEIGRLQAELDMVSDEKDTKEVKIRNMVTAAMNLREGDQPVVMLTARDIKAATGCTLRYAYDLIDDLPVEYTWIWSRETARRSQFNSIEIDGSEQKRAIGINFELLSDDPMAVNKFIDKRETGGD